MNLRTARAALLARSQLKGGELRLALTELTDRYLRELLGSEAGVALIAVGGYGRGEPAPGSDLDLVLLHSGRADAAALAERVFYPIWDSGVALDHSVRTVPEALAVARSDLKAALGLLDARCVAGERALADELSAAVHLSWRRDAKRRLPELGGLVAQRAQTAGELAFLLEPDLKEARGGLRDVQSIRAAAAAWVVDAPSQRLLGDYWLLLDVRGELHRRTGRPADRLVLQEQDGVAQALGFTDADELMRAVYAAGRSISYALDVAWRRVRAVTEASPPRRRFWRGAPDFERVPLADGVVEQAGEVVLARAACPESDPELVLRTAAAAAEADRPISPHTLQRLVAECPPLPEPWPAGARDGLLRLLGAGRPAVGVLESLDQAGLLRRLLPEWEHVRCRPQRNAYHRYTVDRHLMEAAAAAAALTAAVARPDLLLLGAFLHDIGKGYPGDHSAAGVPVAEAVAARVGLSPEDTATIGRLVRHHLLLADTATRRDLDDPATVAAVAAAVADRPSLALLHCLTEADGLATGPAAWGAWKATLVAELVARVEGRLSGEAAPAEPATVLSESARSRAERGDYGVIVDPAPGGQRVTVLSPDRPGLLWRCAAVLALHRLAVLGATALSVGSTAVTIFDVTPRFGSPPDWNVVQTDLRHVFELPLAERLAEREAAYRRPGTTPAPPVISFDDDGSASATIIEVRAHDSVGLLYRIARVLAESGLDVRSARVATIGPEAVDTFYVTEVGGGRFCDQARRAQLASRVAQAVAEKGR